MTEKTDQVYKHIIDHGEMHAKAIANMTQAVARGDTDAMQKYFKEAQYHEQMQHEAGIQARKYFLGKVQHG